MLWLALSLPELPLDALLRGHERSLPEAPLAVVQRRGAVERVCTANAAARSLGVRPGQTRAAAQALAGGLRCLPRREAQEREALEQLALVGLGFTPRLSLEPPDALLLEIGGSLHYFGGLAALRHRLAAALAALGHAAVHEGCAPTPLAALWRARAGRPEPVLDVGALDAALGELPLDCLRLPEAARQSLDSLGLSRLAGLLALPAAGLARRFGPDLLDRLARARGRAPDPRPGFEAPQRFLRRLELSWPVIGSEPLLFLGRRLFAELAAFLDLRALAVQQLDLELEHERRGTSRRCLGLAEPTAAAETLLLVWREDLARTALPAPVTAVVLRAERFTARAVEVRDLFEDPRLGGDPALWLARMRTRLGAEAVRGLRCVADHRPERAWQTGEPGDESPVVPARPRPGWLLAEPEPLPLREERPWRGEPLYLQGRAERIESGWWDGEPVSRDYYLAAGPSGRRYWIYQDRRSLDWYLHGLFG